MSNYHEDLLKVFEVLDVEKQGRIQPKHVLAHLKKMGIHDDDPRISKAVEKISAFAYDEMIDISAFERIARESLSFICNALLGGLIVPEFECFCREIDKIYDATSLDTSGNVASYIPELANVDPELYGISLCTIDGQRYSIGDTTTQFCLQSVSKPINYGIALEEYGEEFVHSHVGREPSGRGFNELSLNKDGLPHNPLINSGAIMCVSLIKPELSAASRVEHIINYWKRLSANVQPTVDLGVYLSERDSADRNFALGYFMKEYHAFDKNINLVDVLKLYFQCCSIQSDTDRLAIVAATLANTGVCPLTNERIFSSKTVKNMLSMMYSCGMYDFSGEFAFTVGLPAKSGVSGAVMVVVPNVMGIAIASPRIDEFGNSVRGVEFCKRLIEIFNFHNYDSLLTPHDKIDPRNQNSEVMKQLATFSHVTHEINKLSIHVDTKLVLPKIIEFALELIRADRGTLFVNDSDHNELYAIIKDETGLREIRFPNDKGIAGSVFQTGQSILIHDPYNDERFNPEIDRKTGYKTKNILCAPVKTVKNEIIGVVQLLNKDHGSFTDQDKKLLNMITLQASVAILHSEEHRKSQKREKIKQKLRELCFSVLRENSLNMLSQKVQDMLKIGTNCQGALLFEYNREKQLLTLIENANNSYDIDLSKNGKFSTAINENKCIDGDELTLQLIQPLIDQEVKNSLIIPLAIPGEEAVGLMVAYNKEKGSFTDGDQQIISEYFPCIAIALTHALTQ